MSRATSKWTHDYILLFHSSIEAVPVKREEYEEVIKTSALAYQKLKRVPPGRMFVTDKEGARINYETFRDLSMNCMADMNENDKLFIFAHGSSAAVGNLEPKYVAARLEYAGVKRVGLITFKSCDVGRGSFLEEFVEELKKVKINIGFAKGYNGGSQTVDLPAGPAVIEKVWTDDYKEIHGNARFRIVKGHFSYSKANQFTKDQKETFLQMRRR